MRKRTEKVQRKLKMKDRKNLHNRLEVIVPESNYIWTFFYNYYQILNNCLRRINKSLLKKKKMICQLLHLQMEKNHHGLNNTISICQLGEKCIHPIY